MPRACKSSPLTAVMLIGVVWAVETRFCEVTTISARGLELSASGGGSAYACRAKDIAVLHNETPWITVVRGLRSLHRFQLFIAALHILRRPPIGSNDRV